MLKNIIAESAGNIIAGSISSIAPPRIGVIIIPMLLRELLTPKIVPLSLVGTLFVNLLVNIGRHTPVPKAKKAYGRNTNR
jgi:hypothetical protein